MSSILKIKKSFLFFTVILILAFLPTNSFAKKPAEYNMVEQKVIPGNFFYPTKRLKEKIIFYINFQTELKIKYSLELSKKRLSELISLVDVKNVDLLTNASQRYAYQAGITTELIKSIETEGNYILMIREQFKKDIPILEELRDNFPANSAYWLLMQQDIDTLNILDDNLKPKL